jgi:hypothetical protein
MSFTPKNISQRDPRWKDEKLGFDDTFTIGSDGCTLTCLSMLVNGIGFDETPSSMNRKLKELGSGIGFLGPLIVWPGMTRAFPGVIFQRVIVCRDQPAPLDEINASLDAGQPLLIEIEPSPSPGLLYHWMVLYARQGDDYLMLDPWPQPPDKVPMALLERYGYGRDPREFISAVAWFEAEEKPLPAPAAAPAQVPAPVAEPITPSTTGFASKSVAPAPPIPGPAAEPITPATPASVLRSVAPATPTSAPKSATPSTPVPAAPPAPQSTPATLTVLVSQHIGSVGLRLRDQPTTNSNTLAILSAGAELTLLEPADQALLKIGQVNQWLNVRDENGNLGYVAAWYVKPNPALSLSPASKPLTVLVSSQASAGLRLRDRPSVYGNILEVLLPGTSLTVLEPASTARAKIGVVNQWLNVKLLGGMIGYVAAWYVSA